MYLGNEPLSASYLTDYFSGNNTTVAFTLSRAPVSASSVIITISGVKQAASTYGVSGTTLTFSAAPPTGTNNIEVLHLGVQPDTVVQPSYRTITEFTATAGQTTFSPASYTVGYIDVYRNGVKLGTADFTATNGTSVVLANACTAGDYVRFEGFLITSFNDAIPNTNGAVGDSLIASLSASKLTGSRTIPKGTMPAGTVLQVVSATKTDRQTFSLTDNSYQDITSLSASITPTSSSSKVFVMVSIGACGNSSTGDLLFRIVRGSTAIAIGDSGVTYLATTAIRTVGAELTSTPTMNYLDSPATTSSTTYKIQITGTSTVTAGVNQRTSSNVFGTVSTITLMEISA